MGFGKNGLSLCDLLPITLSGPATLLHWACNLRSGRWLRSAQRGPRIGHSCDVPAQNRITAWRMN